MTASDYHYDPAEIEPRWLRLGRLRLHVELVRATAPTLATVLKRP